MKVQVNGDTVELANDSTILTLLEQLHMTEGRIAVEVNSQIIPRSLHNSTVLKAGDAIEIVHAIGGG